MDTNLNYVRFTVHGVECSNKDCKNLVFAEDILWQGDYYLHKKAEDGPSGPLEPKLVCIHCTRDERYNPEPLQSQLQKEIGELVGAEIARGGGFGLALPVQPIPETADEQAQYYQERMDRGETI